MFYLGMFTFSTVCDLQVGTKLPLAAAVGDTEQRPGRVPLQAGTQGASDLSGKVFPSEVNAAPFSFLC